MKLIKMLGLPYWQDENFNTWSAREYTEKQAHNLSKTLVNCAYNHDCQDLINCTYNNHCSNCNNVSNCSFVAYSQDCQFLINCTNCNNCSNLFNCRHFDNNKPLKKESFTDDK